MLRPTARPALASTLVAGCLWAGAALAMSDAERVAQGVELLKIACGSVSRYQRVEVQGNASGGITLRRLPGADASGRIDYTREDVDGFVGALRNSLEHPGAVQLAREQIACMQRYADRIFAVLYPGSPAQPQQHADRTSPSVGQPPSGPMSFQGEMTNGRSKGYLKILIEESPGSADLSVLVEGSRVFHGTGRLRGSLTSDGAFRATGRIKHGQNEFDANFFGRLSGPRLAGQFELFPSFGTRAPPVNGEFALQQFVAALPPR